MMYRWILPTFLFFVSSYSMATDDSGFFDQYHRMKRDPNWRLGVNAAFISPSSGLSFHLDTPSFFSLGFGKTAPTGRSQTNHIGGYADATTYMTPNLRQNTDTHQLESATHKLVKFGIISRHHMSENLSSFVKFGFSYLWMDARVTETRRFHQGMHVAIGSEIWGDAYTFKPLFSWLGRKEITCRNGLSLELGSEGHNVRAEEVAGSPTLFSGLYFAMGAVSEM